MPATPSFWSRRDDWRSLALTPLAELYGHVARRRLQTAPRERVQAPVLCVGNLTVGGSGKTPVAMALAQAAINLGRKPGFLSRGHGRRVRRPRLVAPSSDTVVEVGDEPLLLAEVAPTAVAADRVAGARLLLDAGCDFLILDDGFQSARLHMDFALLVVDAVHGIGNGRVFPAGPLRAPLLDQLWRADGIVTVGNGEAGDALTRRAARAGKAVLRAEVRVRNAEAVAGRRFVAFAGIGKPAKFFDSLAAAGGLARAERPFPDHHLYSSKELQRLTLEGRWNEADLITTAKDAARLRHRASAAFLADLKILDIDVVFEPGAAAEVIRRTLSSWRNRR